MFFIFKRVWYCLMIEFLVWVKIIYMIFLVKFFNFIFKGKWFCNLGMRLFGLERWNVLVVMNRICFVLIELYFVFIIFSFIIGNKFF